MHGLFTAVTFHKLSFKPTLVLKMLSCMFVLLLALLLQEPVGWKLRKDLYGLCSAPKAWTDAGSPCFSHRIWIYICQFQFHFVPMDRLMGWITLICVFMLMISCFPSPILSRLPTSKQVNSACCSCLASCLADSFFFCFCLPAWVQ